MIFGIGTDVVEYARFQALWTRYGSRFAERILAINEQADFLSSNDAARFLAKRFAAKEAFAKAIGSGLRSPVSLTRIGIAHDALGKPSLQFDDVLRLHLEQLGVSGHHLSVSDERNVIVAFVVLETTSLKRE